MTLRCDISIIPFGKEENKRELFRLDISNIETVRNEGFGNEICKYRVKTYRRALEVLQNMAKERGEEAPDWEIEYVTEIPEHNRRDGAISLVQKACVLVEERV